MKKTQGSQPIIKILHRVAQELEDASTSVDDLHQLVETAVGCGAGRNLSFMHRAQTVDILQQRLAAISHYVAELAALMPDHWLVEHEAATKKLKLSRLAERLNHFSENAEPTIEHPSGDFEIF